MQLLTAAFGVLLIGLANYDALVTTVAVGSGVRPLTAHVGSALRRLLRRVPRLLPVGGPVITLATIGVWIVLLWAGYSLLFSSSPTAVTATSSGALASVSSRIYFAGYVLFTLGNGGYQPAEGPWELLTSLAALNGLFVITLAITFLLPVVSAVVERRQQAALINALGDTAEDVVVSAWNGRDFAFFERQLPTITEHIMLTAQRHLAYPVLHDFRSREAHTASARTLALLDDVVTILDHGVAPPVRLDAATLILARCAIDASRRLMPVGVGDTETPPIPDLSFVGDQGIPTVSPEQFAESVASMSDRRRHLNAVVVAAAWTWPSRTGQSTSADG